LKRSNLRQHYFHHCTRIPKKERKKTKEEKEEPFFPRNVLESDLRFETPKLTFLNTFIAEKSRDFECFIAEI